MFFLFSNNWTRIEAIIDKKFARKEGLCVRERERKRGREIGEGRER